MRSILRVVLSAAVVIASCLAASPSRAEKVLRVVMHSDLKILDPIWTTAYIVRNHGYMVYDTLFATDEKGVIRLQMLAKHDVSADKLEHSFVLRPGLLWHDGAPVTAEDCVASIKRWAAKDATGQMLMTFVEGIETTGADSFRIKLKEPTGLVEIGLGKPSSSVPFMMPKRVAETDPNTQISDFTGSGPFVFKKEEWKPGDKTVYVKFDKYKPRTEPSSGLAGAKLAKVDRVEWIAISDHQQAMNALLAGEIDLIEAPQHDLLPLLRADAKVKLFDWNVLGSQFNLRPNWLHKPLDNPKIRQAMLYALNQEDFLRAVVGDEQYYKVCKSYFVCGTDLETSTGMDGLLSANAKRSRELLAEAGYDGSPIVLMNATDVSFLRNVGPVAKSLLEKGGFKVDLQSTDWQTLVARRVKKEPPSAGGWSAFMTSWFSVDVLNPVFGAFFSGACEKAPIGWPCDAQMEGLRRAFAREPDAAKRKEIAEKIQVRETEIVTHIPLGQTYLPAAMRKTVNGMPKAPAPVFWNISLD